VDVPKESGFKYDLDVRFIDYTAIWGKFSPSNQMYDEDTVDFGESWGDLAFLQKSNLPFSDPVIDMHVVTKIAGAMVMKGEYLFAEDIDGNKIYAEFNENPVDSLRHRRYVNFTADQYLPLSSTIGDSTTNMVVKFDKDPERGHIDKLFANMPQRLGYKYKIDFNWAETPQIRIVPSTSVRVEAVCTLPLIFNQGLKLTYSDTLKDINLEKATIDSLLADVEVIDTLKTSDLKVVLIAKNTIPLDVKASVRFLDENNNIIMDPDDPTKPLLLLPEDTLRLVAPTYEYKLGRWDLVKEGETTIIASVNKKKMDLLPKIKSMTYYGYIDDESLDYAYKQGYFNVRLTEDAGIKLKIGLSAKVDAIFDFKSNNNQ